MCKKNTHRVFCIVYLGDEPYREECAPYAANAQYLMHEALCLESQEEQFHPQTIAISFMGHNAVSPLFFYNKIASKSSGT